MERLRYIVLWLLVALPFLGLGGTPLFAAEEPAPPKSAAAAQPIHIEADRMESFERKSEVLFVGRVEATQGDIVLHADEILVTYLSEAGGEKGKAPKSRKVDKLFAKGNVKIASTVGWVATGETMDYFAVERKAILIGDAKVWQDNNLVTGNKIVLYLDEGKSIVESDPQQGRERVKAFLYPGGEEEKKDGE